MLPAWWLARFAEILGRWPIRRGFLLALQDPGHEVEFARMARSRPARAALDRSPMYRVVVLVEHRRSFSIAGMKVRGVGHLTESASTRCRGVRADAETFVYHVLAGLAGQGSMQQKCKLTAWKAASAKGMGLGNCPAPVGAVHRAAGKAAVRSRR